MAEATPTGIADAVRRAFADHSLSCDLGCVDLRPTAAGKAVLAALQSLGSRRRAKRYGLRLRCQLTPESAVPHARVLADAGVDAVRLTHRWHGQRVDDRAIGLVCALQNLHGHGISVTWSVPTTGNSDSLALLRAVPHLPPPTQPETPSGRVGELVAGWWQRAHVSRLFALRGPGFVRIHDHRAADPREHRTVLLTDADAELYRRLDHVRSTVWLADATGRGTTEVSNVLARLATRWLVAGDAATGWSGLAVTSPRGQRPPATWSG